MRREDVKETSGRVAKNISEPLNGKGPVLIDAHSHWKIEIANGTIGSESGTISPGKNELNSLGMRNILHEVL